VKHADQGSKQNIVSLKLSPEKRKLVAQEETMSDKTERFPGVLIAGDKAGAGKSTICLAILHSLIQSGTFTASELAYIKPCTQCEDITLVSKYCEQVGIAHRGIGPVRYYKGFTYEVIDKQVDSVQLLNSAVEACRTIAQGKKFVIVDGVGYPSVGSVCGVSNGHIAAALNIPVVIVGRPGVGDALDSLTMHLAFFELLHKVRVAGVVFNQLKPPIEETDESKAAVTSRHSYSDCVKYVTKYISETWPNLKLLGFFEEIPMVKESLGPKMCIIKEAKANLAMNDQEQAALEKVQKLAELRMNLEALKELIQSLSS
jgi:dethiobiotin synthetase